MNYRVFKLAAPVFLELSLQIGIQVVDALMLSRVSDSAAGTVGVLVTFFGLVMTIVFALTQAGSIRISYALGANRLERASRLRWVMLLLALLITLPISGVISIFGESLLSRVYSLDGIYRQYAGEYLSIAAWSVATQGLSMVLNSFFRSIGKPFLALPGALIANIANAVLAYFFVSRGIGVQGVALAAIVGQVLMILWASFVIFGSLRIAVTAPRSLRMLRSYLAHLMTLFGPVVVEPVAFQVAQVAIGIIIAKLGAEAMAARSYAGSIYAFCFLWSISMSQAAQFLVSHEFGRNNRAAASEALYSCLRTSIVASGGLALFLALVSRWLLPLFTQNSEIIHNAQLLLWIAFVVEIGRSSNIVVGAALKAAGDAAYPAKIGVVFMLGLSVPLAAVLGLSVGLGIVGIGIALGVDELVRGFLNFRRWRVAVPLPLSS